MEKVNYFTMAENDYLFLKFDYEQGRVGNIMCSTAQSICERYLKHVIDLNNRDQEDITDVMKTHSIKRLQKFIQHNIPDFTCNWSVVLQANGYYFSARYPGEDSFIVDKDDVQEAWESVEETRAATLKYLKEHEMDISDEYDDPEL